MTATTKNSYIIYEITFLHSLQNYSENVVEEEKTKNQFQLLFLFFAEQIILKSIFENIK